MDVSAPAAGASFGDQMDIDMELDFDVDPAHDVTFEEAEHIVRLPAYQIDLQLH
jgi:hypothetical protein